MYRLVREFATARDPKIKQEIDLLGRVGLVKYCNQKLSEVEKKVELLIKDRDGRLQLKLLDSLADHEEKDEEGE